MREIRSPGSVRGAARKGRPYRDIFYCEPTASSHQASRDAFSPPQNKPSPTSHLPVNFDSCGDSHHREIRAMTHITVTDLARFLGLSML